MKYVRDGRRNKEENMTDFMVFFLHLACNLHAANTQVGTNKMQIPTIMRSKESIFRALET
uniref:Pkinase_fungal domain-containing protein n=1 Tax=Heterorhabditis bacteriophora TaxID=37862 RepID=A0A1I7X435_HETBA